MVARLVRAALTGLGAFISELIPAQTVRPDPAAPDAAAPPPAPTTGDTEPAADLVYAAGVVRAYAVVTPDLDPREVASLNALSERLADASKAAH